MIPQNAANEITTGFDVKRDSEAYFFGVGTNRSALDSGWSSEWSWRQQRQDHTRFGEKLEEEHRGIYADRIHKVARDLARKTSKDLLAVLAGDYGFAWIEVAQMLNVSVPAIRKWRLSGNASPTNHANLAELVAFVQTLVDVGSIDNPATWLLVPPLQGYHLTLKDVYSSDSAPLILDYACGNIGPEALFDASLLNWRETGISEYEIRHFRDGAAGIVRRQRGND